MTHTARCSCGQLSLEIEGAPIRVSLCHCHECQRRTGSAFGAQARFLRSQLVRTKGQSSVYTRAGDEPELISFHFCAHCGSTVFWELEGGPEGNFAVALGAFAGTTLPAPTVSVYDVRRHDWLELPKSIVTRID